MAVISYRTSNSYAPYVTLEVTQQSQSYEGNYSTVAYSLKMQRPRDVISSNYNRAWSVNINGSTVASGVDGWAGVGTKTIASGTTRVAHGANGEKTVSFSFSVEINVDWGGYGYIGTGSASGSLRLDTIPRASTLSTSLSTVEIGKSVVLTINRASTTFKHKIYYKIGNMTSYVIGHTSDYINTGYTFTVPTSTLANLPNSTSGDLSFQINTYNSSNALIGTSHTKIKATVPSTVRPTVTPTLSVIDGLGGKYVRTRSKVRVTSTGSGGTGASISQVEYTLKNRNGDVIQTYRDTNIGTFTSGVLNWYGAHTVTVKIVDSRGRHYSTSRAFTVDKYSNPSFQGVTAYRSKANGTRDDKDEHITVVVSGTISEVSSIKRVIISKKSQGQTSYTTLKTLTVDSSFSISETFPASSQDTHEIRVEIQDSFTKSSSSLRVLSARVAISVHNSGLGVACGKTAEKAGRVEFGMPIDRFPIVSVFSHFTGLHEDVTNFTAYAVGNMIFVKFTFKPLGNYIKVADVGLSVRPHVMDFLSFSTSSNQSRADMVKGPQAYIVNNNLYVGSAEPCGYPVNFYAVYMTANGIS